jgi:hypothetical protein
VHELKNSEKRLCSCVLHPAYPSLLVIGGYRASVFILEARINRNENENIYTFFNSTFLCCFALQHLVLWGIRGKHAVTLNNAHHALITEVAASSETGKIA